MKNKDNGKKEKLDKTKTIAEIDRDKLEKKLKENKEKKLN